MKSPKDNLNKPTMGKANPKKKAPSAPKGKSFGTLGAMASSQPPPMLNSPYNMQGMP